MCLSIAIAFEYAIELFDEMLERDMATANGVWLLGLIFGIGVSTRLFAKASSTRSSCLKLVKENNKYTKFHKKNMLCWFTIKLIFFFFLAYIEDYIL